jgi:hypothetical protein
VIKLILGRVLPGALAAGLVVSAISPIGGALDAFAVAADALTGDPNTGGVDLPSEEALMANVASPENIKRGLLDKLFGKKAADTDHARQEISGLADKMKERADARAAENKKKMGGAQNEKPEPAPRPKKKASSKPKDAAPAQEQAAEPAPPEGAPPE